MKTLLLVLDYLKSLSPALLVVLGWLLAQFEKLVSSRREERKAIALVLADLLEIRHRLMAAKVATDGLSKRLILPEGVKPWFQSALQTFFQNALPDWERLHTR